jgi:LuxR family quorum-sensing system transcriptional regulator CciR
MRISDFIDKSNAATSAPAVFGLFQTAVRDFGYDRIAFAAVSPAAQQLLTAQASAPVLAVEAPGDWIRHYVANRYHEIDPIMLLAPSRQAPFLWKDVLASERLSAKQRQIFNESREAGLRDGLSIPLHGPHGVTYVVSLASNVQACDDRAAISRLYMLATQFFLAYSMFAEPVPDQSVAPHLTDRERECLCWTARGKSAWAISMILHVSEHTVNFHLKSAMKKFGTTNRVQAVAAAVRYGLIQA